MSFVELVVYDIQGREVGRLVEKWKTAESHNVVFAGSGLASGLYFVRLQAGNYV